MDLEEQTLRYYLSLFSLFFLLLYFIYILFFQKLFLDQTTITINRGDNISKIANLILENNNYLEKNIYLLTLKISNNYYKPINYGKFIINKNSNFFSILKTISKKSNLDIKITIIEGWEEYQLSNYLSIFFDKKYIIPYENLLADTYIINSSNTLKDFNEYLKIQKNNFFDQYKENSLYKEFGEKKILIISSLVEKEAKNSEDKGLIASVILNRLSINMKLQIDATVIYSLTEGKKKFDKVLTYKDLKFKHPYNTYHIKGLPPGMISYTGPETVKLVLENNKSHFLFYFYNIIEKKHIFSKNYKDHKKKLDVYRKKIK